MKWLEWSFTCMLSYLSHFIERREDSINKFILFFLYILFHICSLFGVGGFGVHTATARQSGTASFRLFRLRRHGGPHPMWPANVMASRWPPSFGSRKKQRTIPFLIRVVPVSSMASVSGLCHQLNKQRSLEDTKVSAVTVALVYKTPSVLVTRCWKKVIH